jgi:hypothetical protein
MVEGEVYTALLTVPNDATSQADDSSSIAALIGNRPSSG